MDAQEIIETIQHQFAVEAMRRSIQRIDDLESLQIIALKLVETNEASRKMAAALLLQNIQLQEQVEVLGAHLMD